MALPLSEYIEDFLSYLQIEKGCSPLTIRNYRHYLNRFINWLQSEGISPTPAKIDNNNIKLYRLFLANLKDENGNHLKKSTQAYHIIAIRSFLRYLAKNDVLSLPAEKIELPKIEQKEVLALDREQLYKLLNIVDITTEIGMRDKAILETLFSTGLRVSELIKLNKDNIDFERKEHTITGKGGKTRIIFFSDDAIYWIKRYLAMRIDPFPPLFIRYSRSKNATKNGNNMRLTTRSVQRIVKKYAQRAKISIKTTPHVLRHSFATDLLINGADLRSIQELLGHKSITTTQMYTNISNKHLKEVFTTYHAQKKEK